MVLVLDISEAMVSPVYPELDQLELWVNHVLAYSAVQPALPAQGSKPLEIGLRLVDEQEMAELNQAFRKKSGPTNILSFPYDAATSVTLPVYLLGDLVVCVPLVAKEAQEQAKSVAAHWAHLMVHGVLHLLGYDHIEDQAAEQMEALEIAILGDLGFENPYTLRD